MIVMNFFHYILLSLRKYVLKKYVTTHHELQRINYV